jgi:hypothetical protein
MPKPSALSTLSHLMFCGTSILFVAALQAAVQNPEPKNAQAENVRTLLNYEGVGWPGRGVGQWSRGKAQRQAEHA